MAYIDKKKTAEKYFREKQLKQVERKEGESLKHYVNRLTKTADKRLERLEKIMDDPYYKNVDKWAYASAMLDLKVMFGEGSRRFTRVTKKLKDGTESVAQLEKLASITKNFLLSPTSTKTGINAVFGERAKTINKNYGTNFTWQDLAEFFEKGLNEVLDMQYGSGIKLKAIGTIQRNGWKNADDITKSIEEARKTGKKVQDSEVLEMAKKILSDSKYEKVAEYFFE